MVETSCRRIIFCTKKLDYLLEAVQAEMFGSPLYPTIADKAALYCFNIIGNHNLYRWQQTHGAGCSLTVSEPERLLSFTRGDQSIVDRLHPQTRLRRVKSGRVPGVVHRLRGHKCQRVGYRKKKNPAESTTLPPAFLHKNSKLPFALLDL